MQLRKPIYYLGVDIGGSHISCAPVDSVTGEILHGRIYSMEVHSNGSCADIVEALNRHISAAVANIDGIMEGIGLAVPGPFDEARGISLITGVQKFDSLFGLNIREAIRAALGNTVKPIVFINDAAGFALGEFYSGAAKGSSRTLVVTLGTGFGSAFLMNGIPQTHENEKEGIPPDGYLYHASFGESIADDYFSTRRFLRRWKEKTGQEISSVKEISEKALDNDPSALCIFDEFTADLALFISPWLERFKPDTWVIGGNIAKSAPLFLYKLKDALRIFPNVNIKICELWDSAPIVGGAMNLKSTGFTNKKANQWRNTGQLLAPTHTTASNQGCYDIYPAFPLGDGKIQAGAEALARWIAQHRTVVIDGYAGVFWDRLVEETGKVLCRMGKNVRWFHVDAAMKSSGEIADMLQSFLGGDDPLFGKITDRQLINWFDADKLERLQPDPEADINILAGCGATLAGWDSPLVYVDLPKNELQFRMRAGVVTNLGADASDDNQQMYKRFYFADWRALNEHKAAVLPRIYWVVDEQRPDNYLMMSGDDLRKGLDAMSRNFFRARPWFEPGSWGGSWMLEHIGGLNPDVPNLAWSFELMTLENGLMFESDGYRLEVSFDFLMYNSYKEVLGDCAERFKYDFPIRFDFLDTFNGGNLSVQCHPRPEYIREKFGMPFTQDETYYILDCQNSPVVYLGFQDGINPEEFHEALTDSQKNNKPVRVEKYVQLHPARKHDFFLIPNGSIHASGKDNLVLEISSAPYIFTFKMYDWLRLDLNGKPRPINIEHGMNNLYFERKGKQVQEELICKPYIKEQTDDYTLEHLPTHAAHFYDVHRYTFDQEIVVETGGKFHVWMLVEGASVMLETAEGMKQRFNYAETFVIPAGARSYRIRNEEKVKAMMLKAFVK